MPSEKTMRNIIYWLILIIFISFLMAVVLFILSGDNWFTSAAVLDESFQYRMLQL